MIFFYGGMALIVMEVLVFVAVCDVIGVLPALGLFVLAGVLGVFLVQQQGLGLLARMRQSLNHGLLPMNEMFDGFCLLAAGMLLILPGFLSDLVGSFLVIPALRHSLRALIARHYRRDGCGQETNAPDNGVIDGDFIRVRDDPVLPDDQGRG